jgi:hypothetical protein
MVEEYGVLMGMNDDKQTSVDERLWTNVSGRKGPDK